MAKSLLNFKAIAVDLDGTLLGSNHQISSKNQRTLQTLHQRGLEIILASGRMKQSMVETWQKVGVPCWIIAYNGAQILRAESAHWQTHFSLGVSKETYQAVLDLCRSRNIFLNIYTTEGLYGYHPAGDWAFTDFYSGQTGARYLGLETDAARLPQKKIVKLLAITPAEKRQPLIDSIEQAFSKHCQIIKSNPEYTEFHNLQVNKGNALLQWQGFSGIAPTQVVAFGDAENDLEMLKAAGLGIAARNATPGLKKLFSNISPYSNDEDFVSRELEGIFSLNPGP